MKIKKQYVCEACGASSPKWSGRCSDCMAWGTVNEEILNRINKTVIGGNVLSLETFDDNISPNARIPSNIEELDRVLGGGLVSSSVILIGGDPGIGKSTLLLQLSASLANKSVSVLYVTGEESVEQVKLRAIRLSLNMGEAKILASGNMCDIFTTIETSKPQVLVIDSIQTMQATDSQSLPGTISQIRAASCELINYAKQNNVIVLLACHVNKEGQLAGPKLLEHMVDTVLYFEGESNSHYRILRSIKNRFGGVNEIGVFEMTANGLVEISNPSELFLMDRANNVSGTAVFAAIEGMRPLLIEVQALVSPSNIPTPRRSVVGWDINRLSMLIAVLGVRFGLNLNNHEVYLSIAGGIKISEPAADLAVLAALISSAKNEPLPPQSIFFGEVGLSGEVRKVTHGEARVKEAFKLGFSNVICSSREQILDYNVKGISHIKQLL
jgi:DNA repair protein RadA/Sms